MQIQGFIERWQWGYAVPFLHMALLAAALRPKVLRRETGKVTQRLLLLVASPQQREACVKRISIRHASCAPPLSSLETLKTKHLQLVSWILFPQRARGDSYREITTALCDIIHQQCDISSKQSTAPLFLLEKRWPCALQFTVRCCD